MPHPPEPDLYWVQVSKASCLALETVLASRQMWRTYEQFPGPPDIATWQVNDDMAVTAVSDIQLCLGDTLIEAQLDHLPTHLYRGLVGGSLAFTQYPNLQALYQRFKDAETPFEDLITAFEDTVAAGRQTNTTPQLVVQPETFQATWMPERTLVRRLPDGSFFVGLRFRSRYTPALQAPGKLDVGLDLELFPRKVGYTSDGRVKTFWPTQLRQAQLLASPGVLSVQARRLLEQLRYAIERDDSEKIISWLTYYARTVTAEKPNPRGTGDASVVRGLASTVHDRHFEALSLYLNAADIPFVRVDPAGTSQHCGACLERTDRYEKGQRHGRHFYCPKCGWQGCSQTNTARVVLYRGLQLHYGPARDSSLLVPVRSSSGASIRPRA